jgi:MFS family permease
MNTWARRLPFFYGWLIVGVVFVTMAIGVNARTAFSLFFPPIVQEFGWDQAVTAGAFSFGFLVSAVLSPTLGRLMDARGPRVVMELGVAATGLGLLLATLATEPWHIYLTLGVLVGGGSVCLGYTGQSLFLPAWFVRRRGLAMSLAFSGVGVGSIVLFPLLQDYMAETGWRQACLALGLVALLVLGPLNLLLRRRPEDLGLQPDGDPAPDAPGNVARKTNVVDAEWVAVDWTLARAVRTARFWWLALGYFCALFAWYAVQVHQTKFLLTVGFSAIDAAWALGAVSLFGVPGQIALGHLSDRIGREWVWTLGASGFVACYLMLWGMQAHASLFTLGVMVVVQGLLGYGVTSVFGAIPMEIFEGKHYGAIFGTLMLAGITGGAVGPWWVGWVLDHTQSYGIAWLSGAVMAVVAIVAIWLAAPRQIRAVAGRVV